MRFLLPTLLAVFILFSIDSNSQTYRVYFTDKGPEEFSAGSELYNETLGLLTQKSIDRRKKVFGSTNYISIEDAPVYSGYVQAVEVLGAKVLHKLRWENYCLISCSENTASQIAQLSNVKRIIPTSELPAQNVLVKSSKRSNSVEMKNKFMVINNNKIKPDYKYIPDNKFPQTERASTGCQTYRYGYSEFQQNLINVPAVHSLGITGDNVLIAFLDSGFRWKNHLALSDANIVKEYDFINNDTITSNELLDVWNQDSHGTSCFSAVAGFRQDTLIGVAPNAQFLLGKTEDLNTETSIEEDYYSAGVEWAEALGADVISTSLGYYTFDSGYQSYNYNDLDGKTTISAKSVNRAVTRGVVFVVAAGNSGPAANTVSTPADADSAMSVGAVDYDGISAASFTSRGPRCDGHREPDISCLGVNVVCVGTWFDNCYINESGTSLAAPQIAGCAGLMLSAFPELKPYQVRNYLYASCSNYKNPDDTLGYGIPNLYNAMLNAGIIISPMVSYIVNQKQRVCFYLISKNPLNYATLYVKRPNDPDFVSFKLFKSTVDNIWGADIDLTYFNNVPKAQCYIVADDFYSSRQMPLSGTYYELIPNTETIPCGMNFNNLPKNLTDITGVNEAEPVFCNSNDEILLPEGFIGNVNCGLSIELYNSTGQLCRKENADKYFKGSKSLHISTENLVSGVYLLKLQSCKNIKISKIFINK